MTYPLVEDLAADGFPVAVTCRVLGFSKLREPAGTIVHSDRGSQFRSRKFVNTLQRNGLRGSMGRVGACGDNAAMESFFTLLQKNTPDRVRDNQQARNRSLIHSTRESTELGAVPPAV
jgi:transposase InsO family protein